MFRKANCGWTILGLVIFIGLLIFNENGYLNVNNEMVLSVPLFIGFMINLLSAIAANKKDKD